jgi:ribosomal protein S10
MGFACRKQKVASAGRHSKASEFIRRIRLIDAAISKIVSAQDFRQLGSSLRRVLRLPREKNVNAGKNFNEAGGIEAERYKYCVNLRLISISPPQKQNKNVKKVKTINVSFESF